jgi:hypothetical protein
MLLLAGPARADVFDPRPTPTPPPTTTIAARMGMEMSRSAALHGIAFTPFTPARHVLAVALLPPFHGTDVRANRGIAFEYAAFDGRRYVLAEWPAHGGTIDRFAPHEPVEPECSSARSFPRGVQPNGIVWSTARGVVRTLQADGANDARTLESEWIKLIRRGVCR